jgi:type II secretion system protein I
LAFTLIEVLVTLVILSTGIVLVLRAFETSLSALGEARDCLVESVLIRQKMSDLSVAARDPQTSELRSDRGVFSGRYDGYEWDLQVEKEDVAVAGVPADGKSSNTLNRVSLAVWRSGSTKKNSVVTCLMTAAKH